jgi:uncharacterized protein (TIGR02246 family)
MTETRPHDVAAITGVLESHYKAWDAGDADAFVTDYAEDATVIMPGIYRKSREEVRQGMAEGAPRSSRLSVWRPDSTPGDLPLAAAFR